MKKLIFVFILLFMAVPAFATSNSSDFWTGILKGATGQTGQQQQSLSSCYVRTGPHAEVHEYQTSDGQYHKETLSE